ncbi:uncharacterized protein LOC117560173 [Gymnodraco acuticeps]|uniref:Uncharacterized protein LOC117560173 n=1 Tax=Gymnodraco acuticeps TaxID=8218 RepID=A0A6P8W3A7_GYMAC|nr:uncharacterized protein LOC117560173 [Gymnodraco acuticeps]
MKMAGLCWISVLLAVSLSIGDCATLKLDYVKRIAQLIQKNFQQNGKQFSVAVNIPEVPKTTKELEEVILPVNREKFNDDLGKGKVYKGNNAVVAIPQRKDTYTDHAEAQVLDNLGNLANTHKGNILVLYSWLSPCGDKCTNINNQNNILTKIKEKVKPKWKSFAFVFHTVYTWFMDNNKNKKDIPEADIKMTFRNLRQVIVDDNIFRCYKPEKKKFQCVKCFQNPLDVDPVAACVKK